MNNSPVTATKRARVRELHAKGAGRNRIAAELGLSRATVTKIAAELGLAFDGSASAAATKARVAQMAERKLDLVESLYDQAEQALDALDADKHTVRERTSSGWQTVELDFVPSEERLTLVRVAVAALSAAERIELPSPTVLDPEWQAINAKIDADLKKVFS